MAINADTLLDRLYLKSQVARWRLMAVIFGALALLVLVEGEAKHSPIEKPYIARLSFEGIINDSKAVYDLIDDVAENPKVMAAIVWLNTPGGSAVAGEETYVKLRQLSAKKPVVAVMRSVSASAGYMVALGADYIVAREGTITGSIGAIIETAEITDLAEKVGITPIIVRSGNLKASPNPLEKKSEAGVQVLQDVVDDFYNRFIDLVAERRKMPRGKVISLADGRIYSGKRALEYKLIDAIGGEEEAVNWLAESRQIDKTLEIKDVKPKREKDLLMRLTESVSGYFWQNSRITLDGISAIWHPQL